jgi:predicted phosphodiesterase
MKIALVSDVHLEFGDLDFENDSGADVLILGGDICVANDMARNVIPTTPWVKSIVATDSMTSFNDAVVVSRM